VPGSTGICRVVSAVRLCSTVREREVSAVSFAAGGAGFAASTSRRSVSWVASGMKRSTEVSPTSVARKPMVSTPSMKARSPSAMRCCTLRFSARMRLRASWIIQRCGRSWRGQGCTCQ
jgi:hypothetical protein